MESRAVKYSSSDNMPSRQARNARLYKVVSEQYDDNLPLEDNTDEIDMNRLQEILRGNNSNEHQKEYSHDYNVVEQRKRNIDEQRVYDINKILEKAKYENNKLKETTNLPKIDTSILSTLQSKEISYEEIRKVDEVSVSSDTSSLGKRTVSDETPNIHDELSMTRELKFKELHKEVKSNPLMENVMDDNHLSLDLFDDLRPTENTIITEPIRPKNTISEVKSSSEVKKVQNDIDVHSGDTSDIDIIKIPDSKDTSNDFFTSSYEFSVNDFLDSADKGNGTLKIILLVLAIFVFAGVIAYFVIHFGIGV